MKYGGLKEMIHLL